ncbi:ribokinase [Lacticaseibacillus pabuli]|uniref:Ribokinase n=1 Tax=Lacticaseibacillus pabuli TaxID=3025672 RepID=A0ABY7WUH2_9LACO|nr:ribokinase [Lacticaseibacillus sp. KACC 23028]WDF83419.1 ribokinase [Lacticaseibacillus sp. KACC 23028]
MTVVVIGSINLDQLFSVNHAPKPGETLIADGLIEAAGGKGANQAVAAARNGMDVRFVGRVGDDGAGSGLRAGLDAAGVNTKHLLTDDTAPTGRAVIFVEPSGQNRIVVASGANAEVTLADVQPLINEMKQGDVLLATFESPLDTVEAAFKEARKQGITTVLNPAPARTHVSQDLLKLTDIIIPNEGEATALTGIDTVDAASTAESANALLRSGVKRVIITLAENGSYYADANGDQFATPAFNIKAVDSTGAGDTFIGAFLSRLGSDSVEDAIVYATAASGLAVSRQGGQPSIPQDSEVEKYLKEVL